jgi:hypothetical protein
VTPALVADSIVDICGAIGLGVTIFTLHRRDPDGPLTARLVFALGVVAALFLLRGLAWWTGNVALNNLSLVPAALIPLGVLLLTEGMLRRHAPRPMKIAIAAVSTVFVVAGILGLDRFTMAYGVLLALFQFIGFAGAAILLAMRDRASLMASENRSIGRLVLGALVVMPFAVTDFRDLLPMVPVRAGALGALLVIAVAVNPGGGAETRRQAALLVALRLVSAMVLGAAAAFLSPDVDAAQIARFCAVAAAGVLVIGLMVDTVRAAFEAKAPGLLNAATASGAQTRDELIVELARHPLFESARRLREPELVAYDPELLRPLLSMQRVLRRADAPWGLTRSDPAVERVVSLLAANAATHLIVLSDNPVDVMTLAVPVISADPATETALALVRRLLALSPEVAGEHSVSMLHAADQA